MYACAAPSPVPIAHGHCSPLAYLAERTTVLPCKCVEREVGTSLSNVGQCLIGRSTFQPSHSSAGRVITWAIIRSSCTSSLAPQSTGEALQVFRDCFVCSQATCLAKLAPLRSCSGPSSRSAVELPPTACPAGCTSFACGPVPDNTVCQHYHSSSPRSPSSLALTALEATEQKAFSNSPCLQRGQVGM